MGRLSPRPLTAACLLALCAPLSATRAAECRPRPTAKQPAKQPRATANDNRAPAGTLRGGVLRLDLVAQGVTWYPEGSDGCALRVYAFAEEGKPAQIPGPLIRVPAGTEVRVRVRNALPTTLWMRGLQDRDRGRLDSVAVVPAAVGAFRFTATRPGAWYYWGGGAGAQVPASNADGQLVGALIVDAADGATPSGGRVFVMTRWTPGGTTGNRGFQLNAINGRSWPHTERLVYTAGDSVRWHVINASDELHMMHLHGFYFRVEARGDAAHDSVLARARQQMVVTTATRRGEWLSIAWAPDRPGNWLFHCHLVAHMSAEQRLDRMPAGAEGAVLAADTGDAGGVARAVATAPATTHAGTHADDAMAGLVLGVTVRPTRGPRAARPAAGAVPARREVRLFADARPGVFGDRPGLGFVLQAGARPPAADSIRIPGTPLVLTRGEPVQIAVHNRLAAPLGVHWHGIELESYYDGVGGWSGAGRRLAPMIAPGDSFVVRMTPPRAGTFMYHVHSEHGEELASGLYAPLLVLEPGITFDQSTDHAFVIADAGPGAERPTFVNGSATPDTLELVAGIRHRFRLIDIAANDPHQITLRGAAGPATWRALARDGRDLPNDQATEQPARTNTAPGVTQDFEFTPLAPGDYSLVVAGLAGGRSVGQVTTVPIRVRAQ
jgi:FtsP/CotA-like multicopper oxidase with cupredoxin domain